MDETSTAEGRRILVGYDGSPVSQAAVAYAAQRAGVGGHLTVAHAYSPTPEWQGTPFFREGIEENRGHGQRLFEDLPEDLVAGPEVEHKLIDGSPARALVELADARDVEEIVVGSRGFGPFRATLGSVSYALLHESHRLPVVIVPARMLHAMPSTRPSHRIVVGYDGSPTAKDALAHAAYRATREGTVVAVSAYRAPFEHYATPVADHQQQLARQALDEIDAKELGGATLETVLMEAPAEDALVAVAQRREADEIVVGSRGLGRFAAAIGSVAHALLHEADRPVVVVPHEPTAAEQEYAERLERARRSGRRVIRL